MSKDETRSVKTRNDLPEAYYDETGTEDSPYVYWEFDYLVAIYCWACDWGMYGLLYRLCNDPEIGFRPAPSLSTTHMREHEDEYENALAYYDQLDHFQNELYYPKEATA